MTLTNKDIVTRRNFEEFGKEIDMKGQDVYKMVKCIKKGYDVELLKGFKGDVEKMEAFKKRVADEKFIDDVDFNRVRKEFTIMQGGIVLNVDELVNFKESPNWLAMSKDGVHVGTLDLTDYKLRYDFDSWYYEKRTMVYSLVEK